MTIFLNAACRKHMPSESKGPKRRLRENNKHWTLKEVTRLVDGVEEYGVGRWTYLKEEKFSTSVGIARTAMHVKDKWRNLLKAYNVRPTPKKGNAKGRFLVPLDKTMIERIQKLAASTHIQNQGALMNDIRSIHLVLCWLLFPTIEKHRHII